MELKQQSKNVDNAHSDTNPTKKAELNVDAQAAAEARLICRSQRT